MYLAQMPNKPLTRLIVMALAAVIVVSIGAGTTWRVLLPNKPATFLPGQTIVQAMTTSLSNDESVLKTSGIYATGTGIFVYTQLNEPDDFAVRPWIRSQLLFFDPDFATLPDDERLLWLIDYGANQEMVTLPLGVNTDPTDHKFTSLKGSLPSEAAEAGLQSVAVDQSGDGQLTSSQAENEEAVAEPTIAATLLDNLVRSTTEDVVEPVGTDMRLADQIVNGATEITNNFDDGIATGWTTFAGSWEVIDGAYHQTDERGFDFGTVIDFNGDDYTLTADVRYISGNMGAGIYYNMSYPNSKNASQMLSFVQGGKALQWGHFDESGEFIFEDITPVPDAADGEWHTLQLNVKKDVATIILDGEIVADDIALTYTSGYVGLFTNESHVAFDKIVISPQRTVNLGATAPIQALYDFDDGNTDDWLAFEGEWVAVNQRYEQRRQTEWDRISALNAFMIGPYRFSSEMLHIEGDMGAGLIFNMQQRDSKAQSQIVSFTAKGTFLQWGSFDADGIFSYQGGLQIPTVADDNWHELGIDVADSTFSVSLDDATVASGIPLLYNDGFVGLLDGQSWAAYDNVALTGMARTTAVNLGVINEPPSTGTTIGNLGETTIGNLIVPSNVRVIAPRIEVDATPKIEAESVSPPSYRPRSYNEWRVK